MSRVPVSWSMMPAAMKSDALNVAWFSMWKIAATQRERAVQAEQQRDQAEMADRRVGEQALEVLLEDRDVGAEHERDEPGACRRSRSTRRCPASTGHSRAIRNTPSFTIVAECR